jgi:predicted kinase
MRRQPTIYVICGFIGAGKTTFARKLEAETGAVRITKDEWLIRLISDDPTIAGFAEIDARICALTRDVAFSLVEKGIDVILDEGFWAREERFELKHRIHVAGATAVLYYLDTPLATMRERVAARNLDRQGDAFTISNEMFDRYLAHWQPPDEDEGVIPVREVG